MSCQKVIDLVNEINQSIESKHILRHETVSPLTDEHTRIRSWTPRARKCGVVSEAATRIETKKNERELASEALRSLVVVTSKSSISLE